jgi:hypothetical protein
VVSKWRKEVSRRRFHPEVGRRPLGHVTVDAVLGKPRPKLLALSTMLLLMASQTALREESDLPAFVLVRIVTLDEPMISWSGT